MFDWAVLGCRDGRGKFASNRYRYDGTWLDNRQHGAGACQTEAGDKYVGEWAPGSLPGSDQQQGGGVH